MPDKNTPAVEETTQETEPATEPVAEPVAEPVSEVQESEPREERTFTKAELAKQVANVTKGYSDYKAKAEKYDSVKTELDEAQLEIDALKTEKQQREWLDKVSSETGVPASVLRGDSLEEIEAHAKSIQADIPLYPSTEEGGEQHVPAKTKEEILAIEDPIKRKTAIAENLDLFQS